MAGEKPVLDRPEHLQPCSQPQLRSQYRPPAWLGLGKPGWGNAAPERPARERGEPGRVQTPDGVSVWHEWDRSVQAQATGAAGQPVCFELFRWVQASNPPLLPLSWGQSAAYRCQPGKGLCMPGARRWMTDEGPPPAVPLPALSSLTLPEGRRTNLSPLLLREGFVRRLSAYHRSLQAAAAAPASACRSWRRAGSRPAASLAARSEGRRTGDGGRRIDLSPPLLREGFVRRPSAHRRPPRHRASARLGGPALHPPAGAAGPG